jgi:hypothetical protein
MLGGISFVILTVLKYEKTTTKKQKNRVGSQAIGNPQQIELIAVSRPAAMLTYNRHLDTDLG